MRRNQGQRLAVPLAVVAGTLALLIGGCAPRDTDPAAQPAPDVTTFEQGRFDELPQFPRSDPVGPRTEKDGVVARSYRARGTSPEQVLEFYRDALDERWQMVTPIERLGPGTFRAEWVADDYRLLVSATREGTLDAPDDAANPAVAQYSLTLHPLPTPG